MLRSVNISTHSAGTTMRYRAGQSLDMSVIIICDTGIIQIQGDSDSQRRAMYDEGGGPIVTYSQDTIGEISSIPRSSQKMRKIWKT